MSAQRDCIHGHLARSCELCAAQNDHATACEQNEKLRALLKEMIDLAEFWIDREDTRGKSEEEYCMWVVLGHQSTAMRKARAVLGD